MNSQDFINWFRLASPYIHAHRGKTFVLCISGEVFEQTNFSELIQDIALLHSLGIRLVLVHGIRPQIEQALREKGLESHFANDLRITDEAALRCAKAACGEVVADIASVLARGISNMPGMNLSIRSVSSNFITARPLGICDGVDYLYTGEVRRVDVASIQQYLDHSHIVIISPLGYSPTGEVFNLLAEEVASEVAIALQAEKWICLTDGDGLSDAEGQFIPQLTVSEARQLVHQLDDVRQVHLLINAVRACNNGVKRIHLVSQQDGCLLLELFTRDGVGTLLSKNPFEHIRQATIDDIGGLLALLHPLEEAGVLVRRSREKLEMEIDYFTVQARDNSIIACAALYPFIEASMAELACFVVHPDYRGQQRADNLLRYMEQKAKKMGLTHIFVLTTRTAHWFRERGFELATVADLPIERQALYNLQRQSKVFIKRL